MVKGVKDPVTGKVFTYKGFTPLSRVSSACKEEAHTTCWGDPNIQITIFPIEQVKKTCCLCSCHFNEGEVQ